MPGEHRRLRVLDAHYGGDVSRVVLDGVPVIPGDSVRAKRDWLVDNGDALRRLLLSSPYGDPSMCVNLVVDASAPDAAAGYVIMEAMGYPHFSGSNSICVAAALAESEAIETAPDGTSEVVLEAPSGPVPIRIARDEGVVTAVTVGCDPAWVVARDVVLDVTGRGEVRFDLVWSGCFYAVVDAAEHGFALTGPERPALAELGRDLCLAASGVLDLTHPVLGDVGDLAFVCVAGEVPDGPLDGATVTTATYVHPGVVCRCPTGTGTAARLALLLQDGLIDPGGSMTTVSPTGSRMTGRIVGVEEGSGGAGPVVSVEASGRPFTLATSDVVVHLDDDLVVGPLGAADLDGIWTMLGRG